MPSTDNVEAALDSILGPFSEHEDASIPEEDRETRHAFWDYYVIGGRWAGTKQMAQHNPVALAAFNDWCVAEKITVSNVTMGKQYLSPASQREKVDAKWNEMFPGPTLVACPLFDHAADQLGLRGASQLSGDVARLGTVPRTLECSRVIFAGPSHQHQKPALEFPWVGPPKATFMLAEDAWNGVNHMPVRWDGTLGDAIRQFTEKFGSCVPKYAQAITPTDEWLVVTVDYHS